MGVDRSRFTKPGAVAGSASVLLGLIALAIVLALLTGRPGDGPVSKTVTRITAPVLWVLSAPARWMEAAGNTVSDHVAAVERMQAMEAELERLRAAEREMETLRRRLDRYEALLGTAIPPGQDVVTARAVFENRGPFVRTLLIDAGRRAGLRPGHAVMGEGGLLGRIVTAAEDASRVLLITDPNSRVPVRVGAGEFRAILVGDGTDRPKLQFSGGPGLAGDHVTTSGDGAMLPAGLPVGRVVDSDTRAVAPYARGGGAEFVKAVVFFFPQLEEGEAERNAARSMNQARTAQSGE